MKDFSFENNLCRDFLVVPCYKESSVLAEVLEEEKRERSLQKNPSLGGCNEFACIMQTQNEVESFEEVFHTETTFSLFLKATKLLQHTVLCQLFFATCFVCSSCLKFSLGHHLVRIYNRLQAKTQLGALYVCLVQHTAQAEQLLDRLGCADILDL